MRFVLPPLLALQASAALALTAGQSITPVVESVVNSGAGVFTAWFGYLNNNDAAISIPAGDANRFGDTVNRGQTTSFSPGRVRNAFSVAFDGSPITWSLTGPDGKVRTATASRSDAPAPGAADLHLKGKSASAGAPRRFWVVFELLNETPGGIAADVRVTLTIAAGLTVLSRDTDAGTLSGSGHQFLWNLGSLAPGTWKSARFLVENADATPREIHGTATHAATDPDPSDNSSSAVAGGQSSSGGNGGLESNGRLTLLLARRGMLKSLGRKAQTRLLAEGQNTGIEAFIPSLAPDGSRAVEVSPRDLTGVTNASGVYAVDYLDAEGGRVAAILGIATESGTYEHTKVTCDRLAGAVLDEIRQVFIGDIPFAVARLRRSDGAVDHAISFAMSAGTYPAVVDSRWDTARDPRFTGRSVYNFQVWAADADLAIELAHGILSRASRPISEDVSLNLPKVWVKRGEYRHGKLFLDLERVDPSIETVTLAGRLTRTESGAKEDYSVSLPYSSSLEIEVGPIFDIAFELESDRMYLSDGAWSHWSPEDGIISEFSIRPQAATGDGAVERAVTVRGSVHSYLNVFRHLRPASRPVDLSDYDYLDVALAGTGLLEIVPQRASVSDFSRQSRWKVNLTPEVRSYRLSFAELGESFKSNDLTAIFFNPLGDGERAAAFELTVESMSFGRNPRE